MTLPITRNVITDLWPLCRNGEASADSRRLVDAYLATDPSFAETLKESDKLVTALPGVRLSPDAERRLLDDARGRARTRLLAIGGGIAAVAFVMLVALSAVIFLFFRTP